jgi:hypothetical protein
LYASLAVLVASAALVTSFVLQRKYDSDQRDAVRQILSIVDTGYVACVLGAPVRDSELGPKLLEAEMTGALTVSRVRACGELAEQKLAPLEGLRREMKPRLDTFWDTTYFNTQEHDFGVCFHLERMRSAAGALGVAALPPQCAVKLETLEPVQSQLSVKTIEHDLGDALVLDEPMGSFGDGRRIVRRTKDGTTWTTSEPVTTLHDLEVSAGGVWAYVDGHIALLDGERWTQGVAFPTDASRAVDYLRTDSGWTLLWPTTHDALVWRLDPTMTKVLAATPIPALHEKRTGEAILGTVAADGTTGALLLRRTPEAVEIEAHVMHPDGKVDAPRITRLPSRGAVQAWEVSTATCRVRGVSYIAIKNAGTVVTRDGGVTFTVLRGGDAMFPAAIACSDQRLLATGNGHLLVCDHAECRSQRIPHRSGREFTTQLAMEGESARILVTDADRTAVFRVDPGSADPVFVRAWRWNGVDIPALVRADGAWFFMD